MGFDAGSIVGSLKLNSSEFTQGMLEANSIMGLFPGWVTDFMASPILGFANLAKQGLSFLGETIREQAAAFDDMGEAAEKVGVSTEFLSSIGSLAADSGSSVEGLSLGLKFLNNNAADAAAGSKGAEAAFSALGISVTDEAGKVKSTETLFTEVAGAIGAMEDPALKVQAAMNIFGKAGTDLIPTLNLGADGIAKWREESDLMGSTVTADEARVGGSFKTMETKIGLAWDGVKQSLAFPVLAYLNDHMDEILPKIVAGAQWMGDMFGSSISSIVKWAGEMYGGFQVLLPIIQLIVAEIAKLAEFAGKVTGAVGGALQTGVNYAIGANDGADAAYSKGDTRTREQLAAGGADAPAPITVNVTAPPTDEDLARAAGRAAEQATRQQTLAMRMARKTGGRPS